MAQWHKLQWKDEHCIIGGITLKPHIHANGKKSVKSSHDIHPFHDLDWSKEAAMHPETGEAMAHLHDGVVDHIHVLPVSRPQGVSVHAVWRDKDGSIVRQDAHFQAK